MKYYSLAYPRSNPPKEDPEGIWVLKDEAMDYAMEKYHEGKKIGKWEANNEKATYILVNAEETV